MLKTYLQKYNGEFIGDFVQCAYEGFNDIIGYQINYFEDPNEIPIGDNIIVVGSVESTISFFKRNKINIPKPLNIPEELKMFLGRDIQITTMGEFRNNPTLPIFIKPYDKIKSFPSGVVNYKSTINLLLYEVPNDVRIMTSELVDMVSEYRCFVHKNKLVGIKNYLGDFRLFLDLSVVDDCISKFKNPPISYTLDVAITNKNETILIELNDGWSVGSYGLDPQIYVKFLISRWNEICENK
jgi:hypothetical protein